MAKLCITPGDPTGIGPEITVKFLHGALSRFSDHTFVVIGSMAALEQAAACCDMSLPQTGQVTYIPVEGRLPGEISYRAIEMAVENLVAGEADALVTGPIAKSNLQDAGILAHGHTEILEMLARKHYPSLKPKAEMLFLYQQFRLMLLTRHIPLRRVATELQSANLKLPCETLQHFLADQAGIVKPNIAILGVNPHAGEIGGVEETLVLQPLIQDLNQQGVAHWAGPFAADAFFRGFRPETSPYQAVVAAYHDQGLIPFKLIAGYDAVNVTIGLPFIRTSVGHGTAADIVGKGIASERSLIQAVDTAIQLAATQKTSRPLGV